MCTVYLRTIKRIVAQSLVSYELHDYHVTQTNNDASKLILKNVCLVTVGGKTKIETNVLFFFLNANYPSNPLQIVS